MQDEGGKVGRVAFGWNTWPPLTLLCFGSVHYMRTIANEVRHCTVAGLINNDMLICFEGNVGRKQTHVTSKHETSF